MGRRKITIKQIADQKLRHITFNKRKNGLIKKAAELAVLCDVNMLLVFEDDNGSLIQFSRDKISTISQFFKECKYTSLLELTANDYPNFFKVNHYKKTKEKEKEQIIADANEIRPNKSTRTYSQFMSDSEANHQQELQASILQQLKEANEQKINPPFHNLPKDVPRNFLILPGNNIIPAEKNPSPTNEDQTVNGIKKKKNKLGLRLNIQKEEESDKSVIHPPSAKRTSPKPKTLQDDAIPEQIRSILEKTPAPDLLTSPFFDNFPSQFGFIENSPFKFYNQNSKLRYMTRGLSNPEDLSAILKSSTGNAPFLFPQLAQATPLLKGGLPSDIDDKVLDTARLNAIFNDGRIFNFTGDNKIEDNGNAFLNLNSTGKYPNPLSRQPVVEENDPKSIQGHDTRKKLKEK